MSAQLETPARTELDLLPDPQPGALDRVRERGAPARVRGRVASPVRERRPARLRLFGAFGLILSFIIMVLIPTVIAGIYFAWIASDIFVSEAKFAVRGSTEKLPASSQNATLMMNQLTGLNSNQDAYIVTNYIQSLPLLERLEQQDQLRSVFTRPNIDPIARLSSGATTERLREYWSRMVSATVDTLSGVVTLEVRAFTPEDALSISRAIVSASEELVNEISKRKRQDAVRFANEEVARAEARLRAARIALQEFRNVSGVLDPVKSAEAVTKLVTVLRGERIELANELATARSSLSENAPSVQVLTARLNALDAQLRTVEKELTNQNTDAARSTSRILSEYEGLMVEREFSEKFYTTVLTLAETARIEADRQQLYLVTFVEPALAQWALYPRRVGTVLVVFVCATALWSIMSLLVAAVRDHDG